MGAPHKTCNMMKQNVKKTNWETKKNRIEISNRINWDVHAMIKCVPDTNSATLLFAHKSNVKILRKLVRAKKKYQITETIATKVVWI